MIFVDRTPKEVAAIDQAHDSIVWALAWHPLGHILCSGSNDHSCKFWTRNHPGDPMRDKYNLNTFPASILGFEEYEDGNLLMLIISIFIIFMYVCSFSDYSVVY